MITNRQSGTRVDEVGDGIYRVCTPIDIPGVGGFSFNQYLVLDDEPLLFHTGPRRMFPLVREAVAQVLAPERLRWIGFSHVEADECGSLNYWLAGGPHGETLSLGRRSVRWFDTPHLPHGWECGYLFDEHSRTLFCGDLFTQDGTGHAPLTESDILGPSERSRMGMEYYAHAPNTRELLEKLATSQPGTLACMHGSAWRGDGAQLLRSLADAVCG